MDKKLCLRIKYVRLLYRFSHVGISVVGGGVSTAYAVVYLRITAVRVSSHTLNSILGLFCG